VPFFTIPEAFYFLIWGVVAAYLVVQGLGRLRGLGLFLMPTLFLAYLFTFSLMENPVISTASQSLLLEIHIIMALLGYAFFILSFFIGTMYLLQNRSLKRKTLGRFFRVLPPVELLEKWNVRALSIGLPFLTIALVLGVWNGLQGPNFTWGSWASDPLMIASIVLWGIGLLALGMRFFSSVRGRRVADLTVLGFAVVVISLFGAHYLQHG